MSDQVSQANLDFDSDGPRVGPCRLLAKSGAEFRPRSVPELANALNLAAPHLITCPWLEGGLQRIAAAMNAGDLALAAITTSQLWSDALRAHRGSGLSKASPDDPRHPGYPAGAPDDKGGQFRPKDQSPLEDIAFAALTVPGGKAHRQAQRRTVRAALKRVLSAKRLLRLLGENAVAALTEEIPGLDVLTTGAAIEDDLALLNELKDTIAGTDAALDLAEQGAADLEDLQVSSDNLSFDSFQAFKKIEMQKYFGEAGDGVDYHHLAGQGPNAGLIPQTDLQSTGNIVRLPRLIHEEVSSYYSTSQELEGTWQTPRDFLRGKSFEEQKAFGIDVLRKMGIVK